MIIIFCVFCLMDKKNLNTFDKKGLNSMIFLIIEQNYFNVKSLKIKF